MNKKVSLPMYYKVAGVVAPGSVVQIEKYEVTPLGVHRKLSGYAVTITPTRSVTCTCPAFMYRGECKHQRIISTRLAAGDKTEHRSSQENPNG